MSEQRCRTPQIANVPAATGGKDADAHETLIDEKGTHENLCRDLAKGVRLASFQVVKDDLRRTEEHGIDLVEIAAVALEDGGERLAVIFRRARRHPRADL